MTIARMIELLQIEHECFEWGSHENCETCEECDYKKVRGELNEMYTSVIAMMKEHEAMKQKMWNALYAEEDELEKKFVGSEDHDAWFSVYRPWLQRGFGIAIKVIAEQEGQ